MKHIITHFACAVPHLLEVKLDKLIYIAHLYHYSNHGELLTDIRFFSLSFGPHAPIIRSIISELVESDVIYLMDSRTSTDPIYSNPCKIIKANDHNKNKLPVSWQNTLTKVEEDWGSKSFEDILDYTT
ncbi:MAG: type II toxin-antitoxin system antitoxin SocA domain-containing protein, partial [Pseudomonadota bacterium]